MAVNVLNTTEETIPPGGAMEPYGDFANSDGQCLVRKPTVTNSAHILVNGPTPILPGGVGSGSEGSGNPMSGRSPFSIGVDPESVGIDTTYGSEAGSWYFKAGGLGFAPVGKRDATDLIPAMRTGGTGDAAADTGIDDAGRTLYCQEVDKTVKRRVRNEDGSVDCIVIDPCCMGDWYCVDNYWMELVAACCTPDPFEITRIVEVRFTSKTGGAVTLPDYALLVYKGDEWLWTGNATGLGWKLGKGVVDGGVRFECVDVLGTPTLMASWDATGFTPTGDAQVESPCQLTSTSLELGVFDYEYEETNRCGITRTVTGTVTVSVASWVEP